MIPLERPARPFHRSIPEVRALRPGADAWIGARLDRLAARGAVPIHQGRVNRTYFYRHLRLSYLSAKHLNVGGEHFDRHDRMLAEAALAGPKHAGVPAQVANFLEARRAAGTLEFRKRGRGVSQRWVASELGLPIVVFRTVPGAAKALADFNDRIDGDQPDGHRGKYNDLHVQMRDFLNAGWDAGTLSLGPDGVNKVWLARQFGVHSPIYVRYPQTAEVVEAFNRRVRGELPSSPTYPTLAVDLRNLIETMEAGEGLPVFKDRLNETELARRLGVDREAFGLVSECAPILSTANERVRFGDPARPFHEGHGRNYSFRDLIPAYGAAGAARIANRFCDIAGPSAGSGKTQYRLALSVFRYLGESLPKRAVRALATGATIEDRVFEGGLRKWRAQHLALKRDGYRFLAALLDLSPRWKPRSVVEAA